ncbi:MAG TPA: DUF1800 domain-containing protein [Vicinamibacterales bacterium]
MDARRTARMRLPLALAMALAGTAAILPAQQSSIPAEPDDRTIVHVLNRIGFGAAPGDVERVRAIGLANYIDQQLDPSRIPDEDVRARLAPFSTLAMSSAQLAREYYLPALMQRRLAQRARAAATTPDPQMQPRIEPRSPERPQPSVQADRIVMLELTQQKVLRAVYSERQLEEVLVDFWFNHFNVFAGKAQARVYLTEYERDVIRPHALGKFRDLLGAVAESPAMLVYLDNWQSAAPAEAETMNPRGRRGAFRRPQAATGAAARRRGINENYARELMELHTLGVDGGYTQKDVQEVARAFTGWTVDMPRQGGGFRFEPRIHDNGEKVVLGVTIPRGGGKRDGEMVLDLLAKHPSTARFIATKLARRFVADEPPPSLVDRAAARFRQTGGDIRAVVRTIVTSPEFFDPSVYRGKVKTPFEFVVSAVRASDVDARNGLMMVQALRQLGMPLYMCQPPTGYSDTADAWVNTGALLNRMNFAVAVSRGLNPGTADRIADAVMAGDLSETTRRTVAKAVSDPQKAALLLGSPDFQKR